jgi:hypothetical protein
MPPEQTERLANLVASALECAVGERAKFLDDICNGDAALREEAESLLRFQEQARDFIGIIATLIEARNAQRQQLLAERRFNEVRQLAHSLMFEVHDSAKALKHAQQCVTLFNELIASDAKDVVYSRNLVWPTNVSGAR